MKTANVVLYACVLSLTSCVTYRIVPLEGPDASIRLNRGEAVATSLKDKIGVSVSTEVVRNLIYFHVIVKNFSDASLYVDDAKVQLVEDDRAELGRRNLKVFGAEEYYSARRSQIFTGQVLMAISAALSTADAGRSTSQGRGFYTTHGYGRNSYYHGYGTYSYTEYTYDSAKAALEREIAFARVRDYADGGRRELDYLKDTLFYPSDVDAGGEYYGIIVGELGKETSSLMQLRLEFAGTPFTFDFDKQQINSGDY